MKTRLLITMLVPLFGSLTGLNAREYKQESLGLPGDNLNLYAVMDLFRESETLEGFERKLNEEDVRVNNLDLNEDNRVDYIHVFDDVDGSVHNIVLQVDVTSREKQDVAVITVMKDSRGNAEIQLIGDEALYGRNYIIEPYMTEGEAVETPNPGYRGNDVVVNDQPVTVVHTTRVEIAAWPVVRFMFLPSYVVWHSPWYYGYYPAYWRPWNPWYWDYYYGFHSNWYPHYHGYYRRWDAPRYTHYHSYYYSSRRSVSVDVNARIQRGTYRSTYSRPELRREGVALYEKTYPNRDTRPSARPATTSNGRRATGENGNVRTTSRSSEAGTVKSTGRSAETTAGRRAATRTESGTSRGSVESGSNRKSTGSSGTVKPTTRATSGNAQKSTQATRDNSTRKSTTATSGNTERRSATRASSGGTRSSASKSSTKPASKSTSTSRKSSETKSSGSTSGSRRTR